jgi:excisionase family DNA binding protein
MAERTQYLTLAEAADLMSISVKTLRRRIADGTIPAYRCGRRVIRIRADDLERVLLPIPSVRR